MDFLDLALHLLPLQICNTLYMVFASTVFGLLLGVPIGIVLTLTDKAGLLENSSIYKIVETVVNIGRSLPFAILMLALIPFTRWVVGTSLGTTASIVPLTIAAAPSIARIIENCLKQVDRQIVEAAISMGSNRWQILSKVLFPEAFPQIINGITHAVLNLIGYSAMAGLVGGGGLGQVAIQYGYQRFNSSIMISTVILLLLIVQIVQWTGHFLCRSILKKRGQVCDE